MAAPDYINLTLTDMAAKYAADVKRASQLARQLSDAIDQLVERGHRIIGSGAELTFGQYEPLHGLPEGTGQTVFDVVNGVQLAFSDPNTQLASLRDRIG